MKQKKRYYTLFAQICHKIFDLKHHDVAGQIQICILF